MAVRVWQVYSPPGQATSEQDLGIAHHHLPNEIGSSLSGHYTEDGFDAYVLDKLLCLPTQAAAGKALSAASKR